jgi:hypothetical protein
VEAATAEYGEWLNAEVVAFQAGLPYLLEVDGLVEMPG